MSKLTIVLGDKNYSSWSLRPWLALARIGVPFEEVVIPLYRESSKAHILQYSPAGKVPVLVHGEIVIWESLAICEYLAETFPEAKLWPEAAADRAHARALCCEMHAGFLPMRQAMPMNIRARRPQSWFLPDVRRDIERIVSIWQGCRARYAAKGPFLFGAFTIADAMFAPVVFRFNTYGVALSEAAGEYVATMLSLHTMKQWAEQAQAETTTIAQSE